jgi:hypothetical protein
VYKIGVGVGGGVETFVVFAHLYVLPILLQIVFFFIVFRFDFVQEMFADLEFSTAFVLLGATVWADTLVID